MNKTIAIVGVVLVFIIGGLVGFLGAKAYSRPFWGEFERGVLPHMCGQRMERFAEGRHMPFMRGHGTKGFMACEKIIKDLDLTGDQKQKVDDILAKNHDERKKLIDSLREAHKNLKTVVSAKEFDEAAFRKGFQEVSSIKENLAVLRMKKIPDLKAVLTPEQTGYLKGRMDAQREFCKKDRGHLHREHHRMWAPDMPSQPQQEQAEDSNF